MSTSTDPPAPWWKKILQQGLDNWAGGVVVLVIGLAVTWGWEANIIGPSFKDRWHDLTHPLPAPARSEDYVVLIADLDGDEGNKQSDYIARDLAEQFAGVGGQAFVKVARLPRRLALEAGDAQARATAEAQGSAWLAQQRADLLIWGEVLKDNQTRVLHAIGPSASEPQRYQMTDLSLPAALAAQLAPALAALVAADAAPAYDRGRFTADILAPLVARLRPVAFSRLPGLTGDARASILGSFAVASAALGRQSGNSAALEEAVQAYKAALLEYRRERVPLDWAMMQNNLGNALLALGERERGTNRLEQAVKAYQAALLEYTREHVPLDWAMTQNNLGNALWALGERENGTARLEQAVKAYQAALLERTRERVPLDWAATQSNLGSALLTLGERESGTARLEQAVKAYQAALLEHTRERVPLDWAATQNNLGNAFSTLGERGSGTAQLEAAVEAYQAALLERTRERVPLEWAGTQNNLGTALKALGARESGTARLEQAVKAFEEALREFTRERVPFSWAATQANWAISELALAGRTVGLRRRALLMAALERARAAQQVYVQAGASYYVEKSARLIAAIEAERALSAGAPPPFLPGRGGPRVDRTA